MSVVINTIETETIKRRRDECFIYIQNLPWSSCHGDVRRFFSDLDIVKGGISIHGKSAFVALDADTAINAMRKNGDSLHGHELILSIVCKQYMHDILLKNVTRTLSFKTKLPSQELFDAIPRAIAFRRKIRPTLINGARTTYSCSQFSVDEIEFTSVQCIEEVKRSLSCGTRQVKRSSCGRKIHPTSLYDSCDWENYPFFHADKWNESKKIKLDVVACAAQ